MSEPSTAAAAAAKRADRPARVLVVAADPRVRTSLVHLLTSDSQQVSAAPSLGHVDGQSLEPDQCGAMLASDHDVVVLDLAPTCHAEELRLLSRVSRHAPVVVLSFEERDRPSALAAGAGTFLVKTGGHEELLEAVRSAAAGGPAPTGPAPVRTAPLGTVALMGAVFVGPWLVWLSRIAESRGLLGWHLPQGLALWSITPVLVATVAALSGRAGLRDLGARLVRWRVPAWTYAAALGAPLGIAAVSAAAVHLAGGSLAVGEVLSLPAALVYLGYGVGLFLLTEEAGWRGVLLPRLQRRLSPAAAALVVGTVWALWHLPLLTVPGEHDRGVPVVPFLVLVIATSVLLSGLVNAARGSVLLAALFHASFDACYSYAGVTGDHHAVLWTSTAVTAALALLLIWRTRGRLLLHPGHH